MLESCSPLIERDKKVGIRQLAAFNKRMFQRVFGCTSNIGVVQALRSRDELCPLNARADPRASEICFERSSDLLPRWEMIFDYVVEPTEERSIKDCWVIGGSNNDAIGSILL